MKRVRRRLVWHLRDLRLHDTELYITGNNHDAVDTIISLYVINPSDFTVRNERSVPATVSTGPHAARALIGALSDLRTRLEGLGGTLLIRRGNPLDIVPSLAADLDVDQVWWSEDPGYYETCLSQKLSNKLSGGEGRNFQVRTVSGYALYHPDNLPHGEAQWSALARPNEKRKKKAAKSVESASSMSHIPLAEVCDNNLAAHVDISAERLTGMSRIMGDFRRAARTATKPRPCIDVVDPLLLYKPPPTVDVGVLPTMAELTEPMRDKSILGLPVEVINAVIDCAMTTNEYGSGAGETEALQRLSTFIDDGHAATAARNLADVSGNNESANISVYLAFGSLSPRMVFHHATEAGDCEWLVSHMTMRDFFVYSAYKQGKNLFRLSGSPVHKPKVPHVWKEPLEHVDLFTSWATGATGLPLIDAGMKEMMSTGYCSNRVRQNMASVLTKDLELDWRYGAEWMQFCLKDHCVGANWGNWQYFGGVGADPKNRHFRTVSQAVKYDPYGDYIRKWIPTLSDEKNPEAVFRPWDLVENWKRPIVDPATQYVWQDLQRLETFGSLIESLPKEDEGNLKV